MSCVYCDIDVDDRKFLLLITVPNEYENEEIGVYIDGNNNLTSNENYDDNRINYCPICGRKL